MNSDKIIFKNKVQYIVFLFIHIFKLEFISHIKKDMLITKIEEKKSEQKGQITLEWLKFTLYEKYPSTY